ncbi:MAG: hypothetical protein RI894_2205, partial [Bacteroidota bacterium]
MNNQPPQINVEISTEVAVGHYCNHAGISHMPSEFVLDFIQLMPHAPNAQVRARIILAPQNAKNILRALSENIAQYERQFGRIPEPNA